MCLIFAAVHAHPEYSLVVLANRDEFYDRPTAPASFWPDAPGLLAGRDLRAGGTWLGITLTGRIAALTNYRAPQAAKADAPSRGKLVSDFLLCREDPASYLDWVSQRADLYNDFNLLVGKGPELYCYSSRGNEIQRLAPGIHGLSNHRLDTPWPKVQKGREALAGLLAGDSFCEEDCFRILLDRSTAADELLPDTGVGRDLERMLSPIFIASPGYGTRSSTVLLVGRSGKVTFEERSFDGGSEKYSAAKFSFPLR